MRAFFEPSAPPIGSRIEALTVLHEAGIRTYAFIGPMLPLSPPVLADLLAGSVDEVLIDKLNYSHKVRAMYRRKGLTEFLGNDYFMETALEIKETLEDRGIPVSVLFS